MPETANDAKGKNWTLDLPRALGAVALFDARVAPFWSGRSLDACLWWDDVAEGWRNYSVLALKVARERDGNAAIELYLVPACLSVFWVSHIPPAEGHPRPDE